MTLKETVAHDIRLARDWGLAVDGKLTSKGLSPALRRALYCGTAVGGVVLAVTNPLQSLGGVAFAVLQMAPFMRDNRHKRGNAVLGCALLAPQLYVLGAPVAALQVAVAGARSHVMNMVDDESYKTRIGLSAAFWASAIGISAETGLIKSWVDVLPLVAMTFGTLANACPDKMTHIARPLHILGTAVLTPYHIFVSGSLAGMANEVVGGLNLFRTAVKNDIPVKDFAGKPLLTTREQLAGWWDSVRRYDRISPEQAGREDPLKQLWQSLRRHPRPEA